MYAPVSADSFQAREVYRPFRTGVCALSTVKAFFGRKRNVHFRILGLRAVAKGTLQGTALEEDYTADSRTILETLSLDFNNEREVTYQLIRTYNQKSNTYIKLSYNGGIEVSSLNRKCLLTPPVANENIETQVFW